MAEFSPPDIRSLIGKVVKASPSDIRFMAQRLHDHAFERRMSAATMRTLLRELGHDDIAAFCSAVGLPPHIAERWDRFGLSGEMQQVLAFMVGERRRLAEAVEEFESATHVGIDDFLRERDLI